MDEQMMEEDELFRFLRYLMKTAKPNDIIKLEWTKLKEGEMLNISRYRSGKEVTPKNKESIDQYRA